MQHSLSEILLWRARKIIGVHFYVRSRFKVVALIHFEDLVTTLCPVLSLSIVMLWFHIGVYTLLGALLLTTM